MALCFHFLQGRMGDHSRQENWTRGLGMMLASCLHLYICLCVELLSSSPCLLEKRGKSLRGQGREVQPAKQPASPH